MLNKVNCSLKILARQHPKAFIELVLGKTEKQAFSVIENAVPGHKKVAGAVIK